MIARLWKLALDLCERLCGKAAWTAGAVVTLVLVAVALHPHWVGPEQPLPFSHLVHAGYKQISCLFCHNGADRSPEAGMPEEAKCLLCHDRIITDFAPIKQLRQYHDSRTPIPWVRVYKLSDFVFFNHEMHIRKNVDCGECHGDVKGMDRIMLPQTLDMGWCVDCHRKPENKASVDCLTCHR
jgi:hypothetical protein